MTNFNEFQSLILFNFFWLYYYYYFLIFLYINILTENITLVVVQLLSHVQPFATPWTVAHHASLSFTISQSFAQTHVCWVDDAIQPSHPLSPPSPPALNLSQHQGLFQRVSSLHQVAKVLEHTLFTSVFKGLFFRFWHSDFWHSDHSIFKFVL